MWASGLGGRSMVVPERIVVGVDGSVGGVEALRWAVEEAGRDAAEVWAVHVYEVAPLAPYAGARMGGLGRPDPRAEARAALQRAIAEAAPAAGVMPVVVQGAACRILPRMAGGARLLVLGGNRDDRHRPVLGPIPQACVRNAPCPVVIVVPGAGTMPELVDVDRDAEVALPVIESIH
ncbi:MAG: universal stress protein [Streptosporangiales bacterium]|nr:universal stress protein [Streptosporangiales bacterium]